MVEDNLAGAGARSHLIKRPRLTQLLDDAAARVKVILLVAPAGYGKTTLAREWLQGRRHAWHRGTAASADVASLAIGLSEAAASLISGAGQMMRERLLVTDAPEREVEVLAELLTDDLQDWPSDAWFAFDDYQFAMASEVTERFVVALLEHAPIRILLTSRRRPSWVTARRLLYGDFFELGRSVLTMSRDEGSAVLAARPGDEVPGLLTLADGWPAVLGLAAVTRDLQLRDRELPTELYEFFAEELFQGLDDELRRQLYRLTFAPTMTRDLAAVLFGDGANHVIEEASRLGLLARQGAQTYELHPLLGDFLERKIQSINQRTARARLAEVVRHLIERESWDEAFALVQRFSAGDLLVYLVEKGMAPLLSEGRLATLVRWLQFASDLSLASPVLHLAEAELAFREGAHEKAEGLALEASREFGDDHALVSRALSLAGESTYQRDLCASSLQLQRRALSLARSHDDSRRAAWGQFLAAVQLESDAAQTFLRDVARTHGASVDGALRLATARLLLSATQDGTVETARSMWPIVHLVDRSRDPKIRTSFLYLFGSILAATARYVDALDMVDRAKRDAKMYRLDFTLPFSLLVETTAYIGLREFTKATSLINECLSIAAKNDDVFLDMSIRAAKAKMLLAHGAAEDAAASVQCEWRHVPSPVLHGEILGIQALSYACSNDTSAALQAAHRAELTTRGIEARTLAACSRAVVLLSSAPDSSQISALLATARQTGNYDSLVAALRARPQLLGHIVRERPYQFLIAEILTQSRDQKLARAAGLSIKTDGRFEGAALSPREEEVFTLLLQGKTNREIAQGLVLSEATVKVHVRNILRKFGARSRTEAVLKGAG